MLRDIEVLNKACLCFHEQARCYKSDLAVSLQMLFESYNVIFLRQYQTFFNTENKKEKEYERKLRELESQSQHLKKLEKKSTDYRNNYDALMETRDREIARLTEEKRNMEQQIEHLVAVVRERKEEENRLLKEKDLRRKKNKAAQAATQSAKKSEVEQYADELRTFQERENTAESTNELNKALDDLYKYQINQKKESLVEFQNHIHQLMKEMQIDIPEVDKACQTD